MVPAIQAGAQALHEAAFVIVLYVDPAMQAVQPALAVVVQANDLYVPAAHTVQAVQDAAFATLLNVDPAIQAVHARFVVAVQAVDAYVPAAQVVHVVQGAVPDVVVLYVPAAHVKHVEPEQYFPVAQVAHASCRAPE